MTRSKARKHSAAAGALIARAATTTESPAQAQQNASWWMCFVLSILVARGANWFLAGGGRRMDEEEATAAAAERIAAAAEDGTSLPVRLATDVVRFLYGGTGRREPADGGVVSASLLNAKPAVGGIGVEPRGGGVLRVLFTVASDTVADTVVRWRHELRRCVDSTAVFDVLSDREEAQHQALWPAFLAAKVAGKRAQFHRARLVVDGERLRVLPRLVFALSFVLRADRDMAGDCMGVDLRALSDGVVAALRVALQGSGVEAPGRARARAARPLSSGTSALYQVDMECDEAHATAVKGALHARMAPLEVDCGRVRAAPAMLLDSGGPVDDAHYLVRFMPTDNLPWTPALVHSWLGANGVHADWVVQYQCGVGGPVPVQWHGAARGQGPAPSLAWLSAREPGFVASVHGGHAFVSKAIRAPHVECRQRTDAPSFCRLRVSRLPLSMMGPARPARAAGAPGGPPPGGPPPGGPPPGGQLPGGPPPGGRSYAAAAQGLPVGPGLQHQLPIIEEEADDGGGGSDHGSYGHGAGDGDDDDDGAGSDGGAGSAGGAMAVIAAAAAAAAAGPSDEHAARHKRALRTDRQTQGRMLQLDAERRALEGRRELQAAAAVGAAAAAVGEAALLAALLADERMLDASQTAGRKRGGGDEEPDAAADAPLDTPVGLSQPEPRRGEAAPEAAEDGEEGRRVARRTTGGEEGDAAVPAAAPAAAGGGAGAEDAAGGGGAGGAGAGGGGGQTQALATTGGAAGRGDDGGDWVRGKVHAFAYARGGPCIGPVDNPGIRSGLTDAIHCGKFLTATAAEEWIMNILHGHPVQSPDPKKQGGPQGWPMEHGTKLVDLMRVWARDRRLDVVCLQEVHIAADDVASMDGVDRYASSCAYHLGTESYTFFWGGGAGTSAGVAILVRSDLLASLQPVVQADGDGRLMVMDITWGGGGAGGGGDFNFVESPRDRARSEGPLEWRDRAPAAAMAALVEDSPLRDAYRLIHPMQRGYTFSAYNAQARLDRLYVSMALVPRVLGAGALPDGLIGECVDPAVRAALLAGPMRRMLDGVQALGPVARITGRVQTAELWGAEAPLWANPLLQLELPAAQRSVQWREPTGDAAGHALFSPTDAARWLVDGLARVRDALPGMRTVTDLCVLWAWLAAVDMVFAGLRGLEAAVPTLWRMPLLNARKEPIWRLWPPARSVAVERAGELATMDLWDALASFAEGGGMPRGCAVAGAASAMIHAT
ncbi:hypothetical protein FOA52_000356 [Chlamydomonas sp. UWO 241]|nr:hypothetical protein FOA52_000356 [Chlamydomonas sp. UWO 241]